MERIEDYIHYQGIDSDILLVTPNDSDTNTTEFTWTAQLSVFCHVTSTTTSGGYEQLNISGGP